MAPSVPFAERRFIMIKRIIYLIILTIATVIISLSAYADGLDPNTFFTIDADGQQEDYIISTASANGQLYMLGNQLLYKYAPGDTAKQVLVDWGDILTDLDHGQARSELLDAFSKTRINGLVSNASALFALNYQYGDLYRWTNNSFIHYASLDTKESRIADSIGEKLFLNDHLFYIVPSMDGDTKDMLYDYNIAERMVHKLEIGYVHAISNLRDNSIAILCSPEMSTSTLEIIEYDMLTRSTHTLVVLPDKKVYAMCYSVERQKLLFLEDGKVLALDDDGSLENIGALPVGFGDLQWIMYAFPEDTFAIITQQGVYIRRMTYSSAPSRTLRLCLRNTDIVPSFIAANPDVSVQIADASTIDNTAIAQAFVNGTFEYDVFEIEASSFFRSLIDKGYLADLSVSDKLTDDVAELYPAIQEVIALDGHLWGIPSKMSVETWAYDNEHWKEFIQDAQPPRTFDEYIALCERWLKTVSEGEADYSLVYPSYAFFQMLYSDMFSLYIDQYDRKTETFTFDTPTFRTILKRIKDLEIHYPINAATLLESDLQQPILNVQYWGHLKKDESSGLGQWKSILPIRLDPQNEPVVNGRLAVYAVNINSQNFDEAIAFLNHLLQSRAAADERLLKPASNQPVERPMFMEEREALRKNIEYLHNLKESADEQELAQIEETLAFQENLWVNGEKNRWLISTEEIDVYRQMAKHLIIRETPLAHIQSSADYQSLYNILMKYKDNLIDLENCILELNARLKLILLENE